MHTLEPRVFSLPEPHFHTIPNQAIGPPSSATPPPKKKRVVGVGLVLLAEMHTPPRSPALGGWMTGLRGSQPSITR